jgi:probable rRNA maturation factor
LGFRDAELSVTLTDDATIAALAGRFGRAPRPTDVLAFPLAEGPGAAHRGRALGDVVVSVERAEAQARRRRVPLDRELQGLVIHGTLHLLGLDHERPADARAMRALESHLRREVARLS